MQTPPLYLYFASSLETKPIKKISGWGDVFYFTWHNLLGISPLYCIMEAIKYFHLKVLPTPLIYLGRYTSTGLTYQRSSLPLFLWMSLEMKLSAHCNQQPLCNCISIYSGPRPEQERGREEARRRTQKVHDIKVGEGIKLVRVS